MIEAPAGVTAFGFVTSYERKGFYSLDEVNPHVGQFEAADFDGDLIDMGSARYRLFKVDPRCAYCGIKGSLYAKERAARFSKATETYYPTTNKWHFNLYALDRQNRLVLMTKDHVIPKSRGGADADENYVPACQPCNMRKSNRMPGESDRDFYLQRRPAAPDPRNRAQRAADRRAKRTIVKTLQRADAAGGRRVTEAAWGGYTGGDGSLVPRRTHYIRNWLVFSGGCHGIASLFKVDGVENDVLNFAKGCWHETPDGLGIWKRAVLNGPDERMTNVVNAAFAVGFATEASARAYMKGLHEAARILEG